MTDLTELDRKYAAATEGRRSLSKRDQVMLLDDKAWAPMEERADRVCAVALHNAYPALAAELRALRELEKAADDVDTDWNTESADRLREALQSVERARKEN